MAIFATKKLRLSYVRPRLFRLLQKYRIMLETRYLAGLKSLNLCPSERKPFLSLSSMGPGLPMRPCLKVLFCVFGCVLEAKYAICVN